MTRASGNAAIRARARGRAPRWLAGLLGVASIALGAVLVVRPFASLDVLLLLLVAGLLLTGVGRISDSFGSRSRGTLPAVVGLVAILAAGLVMFWPGLTVIVLAVVVAAWLCINGVLRMIGALVGARADRFVDLLLGAANLILGGLALAWPDVTVFVIAALFGVQVMLFGFEQVGDSIGMARGRNEPGARRRPVARTLAAVLALTASVTLLVVSMRLSPHPIPDAFYATPEEVPSEPGKLLRSEPFTTDIPADAAGWRILYTTTRDEGVPAVASAIVVVPAGQVSDRPVVAWAHGTTGIAQGCAPSLLEHPFIAGAMPDLEGALAQGWAVVATDYIGLGTDSPHPYLVGQPTGRAVLDSIRAAQELDDTGLGTQTVVWGHSQGGHAALWAGGLAPGYAPELDIRGVAALAPAANLPVLLASFTDSWAGAVFGSFVASAYAQTYPDIRLRDLVRPTARIGVDEMSRRCLNDPATIVSLGTAILGDRPVWNGSPAEGPMLARAIQNVPSLPISAPLLVAQGDADTLITPDSQDAWVAGRCAAGQQVDHRSYAGQDHMGLVTGDSLLLDDLMVWTGERFAGAGPLDTCP